MIKTITIAGTVFAFQVYEDDFILLKNQEVDHLCSIGKVIYDHKFSFIDDVIASENEIYLKLNPSFSIKDLAHLSSLKSPNSSESISLRLPVFFDANNDWTTILSQNNLAQSAFIHEICQQDYWIAMFGFLPGFVYLNGLPTHLHIPRKKNPSLHIPPNSLALGGKYLGIYSLPSPGGWHVIGKLATPILSLEQLPPISLSVQHKLLIEAIDESTYIQLTQSNTSFHHYNGIT